MQHLLIDAAAIAASAGIGWSTAALLAQSKIGRLTDLLDLATERRTQLARRNGELLAEIAIHRAYRAVRSAAVSKGNRLRAERQRAKVAAKTAQLASGK